jgi:hypothetical protein
VRLLVLYTLLALLFASCAEGPSSELPDTTDATTTSTPTTTTTTTEAPSTKEATTPTEATTTTEPNGSEVTIEWRIHEDPEMMDYGTFTASGPAVEDGLLCSSGTSRSLVWEQGGPGREMGINEYTCDDGSGTFEMEFQWQFHRVPLEDGSLTLECTWIIWEGSGSGSFETLSGKGVGEGKVSFREADKFYPTDASETYTGHVTS